MSRRRGKSIASQLAKDSALKAGKRVLVGTPAGWHIEKLHRSGLKIITPCKGGTGGVVIAVDEHASP